MMNDRSLDYIRHLVRLKLNEDVPTNNLGAGSIAGTKEAGDLPPVNLKKKKSHLFGLNRDLFRRKRGVQQ